MKKVVTYLCSLMLAACTHPPAAVDAPMLAQKLYLRDAPPPVRELYFHIIQKGGTWERRFANGSFLHIETRMQLGSDHSLLITSMDSHHGIWYGDGINGTLDGVVDAVGNWDWKSESPRKIDAPTADDTKRYIELVKLVLQYKREH